MTFIIDSHRFGPPAGPFDPASIAGLQFWVKADQITGKIDGDPISQWDDQSGNARHATQATGANQPTYKTNILNGLPVVRFDGSNDVLATSAPATTATDNWTLVLVCDPTTNSVNGTAPLCNGNGEGNGYAIAVKGGTSGSKAFLRGGLAWHESGVASDTTLHIWIAQRASGTTSLYVDGSSAILTTASAPNAPTTRLAIGNHDWRAGQERYFNGDVGEAFVWNTAVSKANLNLLGGDMASKWGFSWTTIP